MIRLELELDNKAWMTNGEKEDFGGLDVWEEWITNAYHSKSCTGRFWGIREDLVDPKQTVRARHAKRRVSPEWTKRWQLLTDKNGIGVWPNECGVNYCGKPGACV